MYVVAIVADILGLIQLIPFVGWFLGLLVTIFFTLVFAIFGSLMGVNLFSSKNISYTLVALGFESILGVAPVWTIRVYFAKKKHREELQHMQIQETMQQDNVVPFRRRAKVNATARAVASEQFEEKKAA